MADIKISQLGAAIAVGDTDLVPIVSGGNTLKATAAQVKEHSIGNTNISSIGDGSVTGAISALNTDKQPKTLDTPLTIGGVSKTTVEAALDGLNSESQSLSSALTTETNTRKGYTDQIKDGYIYKGSANVSVTADGVKTCDTLMNEVYLAFKAYLDNHTDLYAMVTGVRIGTPYGTPLPGYGLQKSAALSSSFIMTGILLGSAHSTILYGVFASELASCYYRQLYDGSLSDVSSTVLSSGGKVTIYFDYYTKVS